MIKGFLRNGLCRSLGVFKRRTNHELANAIIIKVDREYYHKINRRCPRTEEPSFMVLRKLEEGFDIREYDPQIRAASPMGNKNRSFCVLAGYVFGQNDRREKIGMTVL